jgi:hypothetical protein
LASQVVGYVQVEMDDECVKQADKLRAKDVSINGNIIRVKGKKKLVKF